VTPENRRLLLHIADQLIHQKAKILAEWIEEVHADRRIQTSEQVSRTGLIDHLPKLLDTVSELLRFESGEANEVMCEEARKHGSYRWEQGYRLDEMVRELMIFRSVMVRFMVSMEIELGVIPAEVRVVVMERLHRLLDEMGWSSTEQFVNEQQRILVRANEARARLIRNVSHELRNVLNGLVLAGELIEDETSEAVLEMRSSLQRNVAHMKDLLDDLLDLSSLVNGQQMVRAAPFSPAGLMRELERIYRPMAEAKGLAFHTSFDEGLKQVLGDERKIQQVAANLLSNAIKYTHSGAVRLVFHKNDEDRWSLIVEDTGVGISESDQQEIFSEFYRAESSSNVQGVGLGLAICCRLVELLGGEIRLSSALNMGSHFEVILPRQFKAPTAPQKPGVTDPLGGVE
jgi:signal transduction histidine kinase